MVRIMCGSLGKEHKLEGGYVKNFISKSSDNLTRKYCLDVQSNSYS